MSLGGNINYQVRVTKRRFNKGRFFGVLLFLVLISVATLSMLNVGAFKNIHSIFANSQGQKESTLEIEKTKNNNAAGSNSSNSAISTTDKNTAKDGTTEKQIPKPVVRDYSILKSQLQDYIKNFQGTYGIHFIDLVNGKEFGINDTEQYIAASTVKVPINLYLFNKIAEGTINPLNTMTYQKGDYEGGTGSIQGMKVGTKFTIRDLSKLSIRVSDNIATNMLIRLLGRQNYKDFMKKMGGTVVTSQNVSCPLDMAVYMKKVYDFQKENPNLGDELIGYLETTVYTDRLPKFLPADVKVAHKIGNYWGGSWGAAFHDVGIVYVDNNPYVIAVMSKNISEKQAFDVIGTISKKVYDFMTKK